MNAFMKTMSEILINDLVEELSEENSRLFNELLFANKCLLQLKTHLIDIHLKYKTVITSEDKRELSKQLHTFDARKDSVPKTRMSPCNVGTGSHNSSNEDKHVIHSESSVDSDMDQNLGDLNEYSDESYVENNTKNQTKLKTKKTKTNLKTNIGSEATAETRNECPKVGITYRWAGSGGHVCGHMGCGKTFTKLSYLKKHSISHLTVKPFKCDYNDCDREFAFKCLLLKHIQIHNKTSEQFRQKRRQCFDANTESYVCSQTPDCGHSFKTYQRLRVHITQVHSGHRFVCDYDGCDKRYKLITSLKVHKMSVHEKLRPYRCPHPGCEHNTTSKDHLNKHMTRLHSDNRQLYRCQYGDCDRSFKDTKGLRSHVVLKHTDDHYVCPIDGCGRRYGDHNDLKYHMRTHSSEPAFPCRRDGCPEVFRSEHYLKKHRVSVHKDRPKVKSQRPTMACEWPGCDYKANKQLLQVHRDLHTGAKPYVCEWPNCGKRFRLQSNLKDHKNVHNNLKPYECQWPGCQYKCNNSGNLIKHVKHMHH